jgi:hypothetical protein
VPAPLVPYVPPTRDYYSVTPMPEAEVKYISEDVTNRKKMNFILANTVRRSEIEKQMTMTASEADFDEFKIPAKFEPVKSRAELKEFREEFDKS